MSNPSCDPKTHPSKCSCCQWRLETEIPELYACNAALETELEDTKSILEGERILRKSRESELAAYKKAKAENDERFIIERDEARREVGLVRGAYDAALEQLSALKRGPDDEAVREALDSADVSSNPSWQTLADSCRKAWARVAELEAAK